MNYDDWKLATPAEGEGLNDELIECYCCGSLISPYAINELNDLLICNKCFKKYLDE